jgi:glycerol-3-phosphate dehydrogenase (NAD(P)+)
MSELIADALGTERVAVLSGPSHAEEVVRGIPTAIVAAARSPDDAKAVQRAWNSGAFRVYTSDDPVGVEVGGAVKNVIAIAVGCSDGLGYGDNTRAALITRGLAEISRFAHACGAKPHTASGLSGMGDLIVTCTSRHSRNRAVGERLGRGESIDGILSSMKMVAEGVWNSHVVKDMAGSLGVAMPITEAVYGVCHEGLSVHDAIASLMNRPLKDER